MNLDLLTKYKAKNLKDDWIFGQYVYNDDIDPTIDPCNKHQIKNKNGSFVIQKKTLCRPVEINGIVYHEGDVVEDKREEQYVILYSEKLYAWFVIPKSENYKWDDDKCYLSNFIKINDFIYIGNIFDNTDVSKGIDFIWR